MPLKKSGAGRGVLLVSALAVAAICWSWFEPNSPTTPFRRNGSRRHATSHARREVVSPVALRAASCGEERWSVKTGTDADAARVDLSAGDTTVGELVSLRKPLELLSGHRINPYELLSFRLRDVILVEYKLETDRDYHLVISDGERTMIAEIPDPECVGASSPFLSSISAARATFDANLGATPSFRRANVVVTLTGIGFFDYYHYQTGVAPNAFELHPVTAICFGAGCSVEPTTGEVAATSPPSGGQPAGLRGCGCAAGAEGSALGWMSMVLALTARITPAGFRRKKPAEPGSFASQRPFACARSARRRWTPRSPRA
jgi:hypothetical protein